MLVTGPTDSAPQSLEQIRSKLQQLTTSLQALQHRLLTTSGGAPLPPWPQIQSSLTVVLSQIGSLTETLAKNADDLQTLATHPNPMFPIATHEGLLTTLLRTKPLPESESWTTQAQEFGATLTPIQALTFPVAAAAEEEVTTTIDDGEMQLSDALSVTEWLTAQKTKRQWTGYYTKAEINDAFEIEKDDLDDIRKARLLESEKDFGALKAMIKFARCGR